MTQVIIASDGNHVEDFCKREVIDPDELGLEIRELFAEELELESSRRELAGQVGLTKQALNTPVERTIQETIVSACYEKLEGKDYRIWRTFLPTVYSSDVTHLNGDGYPKPWFNYNFDSVPIEVLTKIKQAKFSKLFTRLEIWSPEKLTSTRRRLKDPMVVGVIEHSTGPTYYQIVRWGEALLPFKTIKRKVRLKSLPTIFQLILGTTILLGLLEMIAVIFNKHGFVLAMLTTMGISFAFIGICGFLDSEFDFFSELLEKIVVNSSVRTQEIIKKILD